MELLKDSALKDFSVVLKFESTFSNTAHYCPSMACSVTADLLSMMFIADLKCEFTQCNSDQMTTFVGDLFVNQNFL